MQVLHAVHVDKHVCILCCVYDIAHLTDYLSLSNKIDSSGRQNTLHWDYFLRKWFAWSGKQLRQEAEAEVTDTSLVGHKLLVSILTFKCRILKSFI